MLLSSGSGWGMVCSSGEGLGVFRGNIARLSEPWMDTANSNRMIKTLLWLYSSLFLEPFFQKGLNEAENLSKCGEKASRPRVSLHMTTHVFWERMVLLALLRAKPSSPSSYHIHSGLGTNQPCGKSCLPDKCSSTHTWARMNKAGIPTVVQLWQLHFSHIQYIYIYNLIVLCSKLDWYLVERRSQAMDKRCFGEWIHSAFSFDLIT